jgi:hypothetical protein
MSISRLPAVLLLSVAQLATCPLFPKAGAAEKETYSKFDPCVLVPRAEAEKILGELKEAPKSDTGIQQEKECDYTTTAGAWLKARLYSSERWGMQKGTVSEMNPTDLPGLGEEAFAVKRGTTYEIYVRKGVLILEVSSTVGADSTTEFAERAVKQLP